MSWRKQVWIFDLVATKFLAPIELMSLSKVCKELKDRVIKYLPGMEQFFKDKNYYPTWFIFVIFLMKNPIRKKRQTMLLEYMGCTFDWNVFIFFDKL